MKPEDIILPTEEKHPLIKAQEDLSEKEQMLAIALVDTGSPEDAAIAAGYTDMKKVSKIMNKKSFATACKGFEGRELRNTFYTRLLSFNYKAAKLYELIEMVSTDPQKAKEYRYTPAHMLKSFELLNAMQGHNAPEQKVQLNYNQSAHGNSNMKNVTPEGNEEVVGLIIEYDKEY